MRNLLSKLILNSIFILGLIAIYAVTFTDLHYQYYLSVNSIGEESVIFDLEIESDVGEPNDRVILLESQRTPFQLTLSRGIHRITIVASNEKSIIRSKVRGELNGNFSGEVNGEYVKTVYDIGPGGTYQVSGGNYTGI